MYNVYMNGVTLFGLSDFEKVFINYFTFRLGKN